MLAANLDDIEKDKSAFVGRNISEILADTKKDEPNTVVDSFAKRWFVDLEAVMFAVYDHVNGVIPNASVLKDSLRYSEYKESTEGALKKPKARTQMIAELEGMIQEEVVPLKIGAEY